MTKAPISQTRPRTSAQSTQVKYYLVAYNLLSCLGWSYVFFTTVFHLVGLSSTTVFPTRTASAMLARVISSIPFATKLVSTLPTKNYITARLPEFLIPLYERMQTTYAVCGPATALVQSFAVLEIVHSLTGSVKSPLSTTFMQVFSRLFMIWGITERFESTRTNPLYASMVFAWSLTEMIRYSFYAISLLDKPPPFLLYLRYTTFYVLYPLGASSEAFLIYATLPTSVPWNTTTGSLILGNWLVPDYIRAFVFVIWWPGLFVMFTHMVKQRSKIFGKKNKFD